MSRQLAWQLLHERTSADYRQRTEDPRDPETVQAMQLVINLPKQDPPARNAVLVDAARATVAVCLAEQAGQPGPWREHLQRWYDHRIRKVTRRARNKAWLDVQEVPGVTVGSVRAFVPSAVCDVPHEVSKLQIKGTDLPMETVEGQVGASTPVIVVDAGLEMSAGKAAAQVGHASMLLAAQRPLEWVQEWAEDGFPLSVREADSGVFAECLAYAREHDGVVVADAGFTEVAPGSVTALAFSALPPSVLARL
ncbi:aminoacyl-tRNA hydrolase [Corynebacterium sp. NML120713]|uniref:aminoacyl-tRNA hydrolase n=1 Tax=Corynebacterium sp. NML120713 TaxID=1906332 RepID=UPI0008FB2C20|nr:aminoacyl-tRNA hydrolase [Corynebacterium sp. NML120713]OIR41698.1 hypothetical protein BJP06_09760 [Corynebacterium sp. NML120713]